MFKKFFLPFLLFALLLTLPPDSKSLGDKIYQELEVFSRILEIVDASYVEPVEEHKLITGAINGMLLSLDPYSVYMSQEVYKNFKEDTEGRYAGVGLEVTIKDELLTVVAPLEDGPAAKAGVKAGDVILGIDGASTKEMTLYESVSKMKGAKGKKVTLTIGRAGEADPINISIVREMVAVKSVKSELLVGGLALIRVASFQDNCAEEVKKNLEDLEKKNNGKLKGIILDLRDNPGGLVDESVKMADLFLTEGVVVSTKDRSKQVDVEKSKTGQAYEKTPMVVLVNKGSASASEILAGAIQDLKRGKIIGTQTFGKGSVQTIFELGNGSALKVTIARYFTPKNRSIEGKGITPDVVLDEKLTKDEILQKATEMLKQ